MVISGDATEVQACFMTEDEAASFAQIPTAQRMARAHEWAQPTKNGRKTVTVNLDKPWNDEDPTLFDDDIFEPNEDLTEDDTALWYGSDPEDLSGHWTSKIGE